MLLEISLSFYFWCKAGQTLINGDFSIVNVLHKRAISTQFSKIPFFLFLKNQTEIILMPGRDILGWHILLPLTWMLMHSSFEAYPDFFTFLAIMNSAAVHNCILVCIWT